MSTFQVSVGHKAKPLSPSIPIRQRCWQPVRTRSFGCQCAVTFRQMAGALGVEWIFPYRRPNQRVVLTLAQTRRLLSTRAEISSTVTLSYFLAMGLGSTAQKWPSLGQLMAERLTQA